MLLSFSEFAINSSKLIYKINKIYKKANQFTFHIKKVFNINLTPFIFIDN